MIVPWVAYQRFGDDGLLRRQYPSMRAWVDGLTASLGPGTLFDQPATQLGDWLDAIALYTLLLRLTGSGAALAGLLVAQSLPSVLVGLGAGVLIDRMPRKTVLIAADLLSADERGGADEAELAPYRPGRFAGGSIPAAGDPGGR